MGIPFDLLNHPRPSTADYRPANVSPLIEFFAGLIGKQIEEVSFLYDNNDPENAEAAILVSHATVIPVDYSPPTTPLEKSPAMIAYEARATVSARLKEFADTNGVEYFKDITVYGNIDYPPGPAN